MKKKILELYLEATSLIAWTIEQQEGRPREQF